MCSSDVGLPELLFVLIRRSFWPAACLQVETLLTRAKGKVGACATAARILLNTGLKHATGFSDEPRVRSTLGCLMLIEWCVPRLSSTCCYPRPAVEHMLLPSASR